LGGHIDNLALSKHAGHLGQEVQHVLDGAPAPSDGQRT
jgi:hypothetical protein